ncbi:MAG: tRNA (adenosine(37)-N6)-dimethylallyltransferase MiaA, partial [Bacteroidota bacterium]
MHRRVLVLVGSTGSGKTPVSLLLATLLDGEIISADSRQMYRFMNIGTAKPDPTELRQTKHYFIDEVNPNEDFNAGEYGRKGQEIVTDILSRGKTPLVVGGSGLYVRALVDGLFVGPGADAELRKELYERLRKEGRDSLYEELRRVDPTSAMKMLPSNTRRVIRALEVYHLTGVPISQ